MDPTQFLLIVLVAVVIGWFALGTIANIRRGSGVLRWMQGGLPRLGERTTVRWMGSSVAQLEIAKARPPFRHITLAVVLEPRDVPWFWLLTRRQGRRDTLILRAELRQAPAHEFDLLAPAAWSPPAALPGWGSTDVPEQSGATCRAPAGALTLARERALALTGAARQALPVIWRLSSRRSATHLELHAPLPDVRRADARAYFEAIAALAQQLAAQ